MKTIFMSYKICKYSHIFTYQYTQKYTYNSILYKQCTIGSIRRYIHNFQNDSSIDDLINMTNWVRLVIPKVRYSEQTNFVYLEVR